MVLASLLLPVVMVLAVASAADRISLPDLARQEGVSPVTVWRWSLRGCCGVVLPTFCVGHKRYTTRSAFAKWVEDVTAARNGVAVSASAPGRNSQLSKAEREAELMGV